MKSKQPSLVCAIKAYLRIVRVEDTAAFTALTFEADLRHGLAVQYSTESKPEYCAKYTLQSAQPKSVTN
jgi:hypothetical protein